MRTLVSMIRMPALLALLAVVLAGCGFHLRQTLQMQAELSRMRLQLVDPYSGLGESLGEALRDAGITLSEDASSGALLSVSQDQIGLAPLTIGASGRVQEYALRYRVTVALIDASGKVWMPKQEIELSRDYAFDTAQSLGSPGEEEVVRAELRRDMVQAIVRRIEAAVRAHGG